MQLCIHAAPANSRVCLCVNEVLSRLPNHACSLSTQAERRERKREESVRGRLHRCNNRVTGSHDDRWKMDGWMHGRVARRRSIDDRSACDLTSASRGRPGCRPLSSGYFTSIVLKDLVRYASEPLLGYHLLSLV
jgi:hypothetical protein